MEQCGRDATSTQQGTVADVDVAMSNFSTVTRSLQARHHPLLRQRLQIEALVPVRLTIWQPMLL